MSEQERGRWDRLDAMPTEALEELLRLDSQLPEGEGLGADAVLRAAEVIARRESAGPGTAYPDVDQAWQRFLTKYYPCEPLALAEEAPGAPGMAPPPPPAPEGAVRPRGGRNARWLARAALAAAAIAVLLLATTVTASAFGYDLWGVIAEWSREAFTFTANDRTGGSGPDAHQAGASADPGEAEYSSLQDALDSYGISTPLAPAWIPERFELDSVDVGETSSFTNIGATYVSEENVLVITILLHKGSQNSFAIWQKDADEPLTYEVNGITHYIMTNMGRQTAVWLNGNYECGISGDITHEELLRMLDSIYE